MVFVTEISKLEVYEALVEVGQPLCCDPEREKIFLLLLMPREAEKHLKHNMRKYHCSNLLEHHSLEHRNLLHSDGSLVLGAHIGKHIGSKPRKTITVYGSNRLLTFK